VTKTQLYLIIDATTGAAGQERVRAALAGAPVASVLIRSHSERALDASGAKPYVDLIQAANVAALIDNDPDLARAVRADGVHLRPGGDLDARYANARDVLGTRYVIGVDVGGSRHDAMAMGEAGADYIAFQDVPPRPDANLADDDEPVAHDDLLTLAEWWAAIFEVPGVAFVAGTPEGASKLAATGIEFVAVALPPTLSPADARECVKEFSLAIAMAPEQVS
jgi:thiamine-phosphate pyrophosphorylase